jgi:glycosyltransferase involved in cell wall biosynthesis
MKVVHLSTSDTNGGAAIAALRIFNAQVKSGIDSKLLVQSKHSNDPGVISLVQTFGDKLKFYKRFLEDELSIRTLSVSSRGRFTFPYFGLNLSKNKLINEADILNLHWINGGFISFKTLSNLGKINKPIVWTLHDMWSFTGGCHYNVDCEKFKDKCGFCPSLKIKTKGDLSNKIYLSKSRIYKGLNLKIVTSSNWLRKEAERSSLFRHKDIQTIPTPMDTKLFKPLDMKIMRKKLNLPVEKKLILFASMNLTDERKGFRYLIQALSLLKNINADIYNTTGLVVFGSLDEKVLNDIPFQVYQFGKINSQESIVECYNAADLFVAPSLQDNLPNTVIESTCCGTPVVGFDVGGMPDMIDHLENGYLAKLESSEDLAKGINTLLSNPDMLVKFGLACRVKAEKLYNEEKVAYQYKELYTKIIS